MAEAVARGDDLEAACSRYANLALAVFWAAMTIGRLLVTVVSTRAPGDFPHSAGVGWRRLMCVGAASGATSGVLAFALAGLAGLA